MHFHHPISLPDPKFLKEYKEIMKILYTKENQIFGEIKYIKNIFTDYKMHFHYMLSFGIIEKGSLGIIYKNNNTVLSPNSIAIFNPYQSHQTKNINATGYYTIYLDIDWCKKIQSELFLNSSNFIPLSTSKVDNDKILRLCQDILSTDNKYKYIEQLINIIKNIFLNYSYNNVEKNKICTLSNQIKQYIHSNINFKISINNIANDLGYNKSYLIRLFKKETGITPQNFIINQRINMAKKQLNKFKQTSLTTIAYDNGFYDQSHFNRNFKKIFATTPKSHKKSISYNK